MLADDDQPMRENRKFDDLKNAVSKMRIKYCIIIRSNTVFVT